MPTINGGSRPAVHVAEPSSIGSAYASNKKPRSNSSDSDSMGQPQRQNFTADNNNSTTPPDKQRQEQLMQFVKQAYNEVMERRNVRESEALREALRVHRDGVLNQPRDDRVYCCYPRLPSNQCDEPLQNEAMSVCLPCSPTENDTPMEDASMESEIRNVESNPSNELVAYKSKPVSVKIRSGIKGKMTTQSFPFAIPLEGTHDPLPKSSATIFLKTHYATEDEKNLAYVPYFGEDDDDEDVLELYDTADREKKMEFGAECQERDVNDAIDETLALVQERLQEHHNFFNEEVPPVPATTAAVAASSPRRSRLQNRIHHALAKILDEDVDRIHDRYQKRKELNAGNKEHEETPVDFTHKLQSYNYMMDTYRPLFCRRCFTYDCNVHGCLPKPRLGLQGELAVQKEREGYWENHENYEHDVHGESQEEKDARMFAGARLEKRISEISDRWNEECADQKELTQSQKVICERAFLAFQGDVDKIAVAIGAPAKLVAEHIESSGLVLSEFEHIGSGSLVNPRQKRSGTYTSMKNYNFGLLRKVGGAEIHPYFEPCSHNGPCSEENCTCIQNAFFCTKHCVWAEKSQNFFRGCSCKGACCNKSCSCFAANRECDPDLCRSCGACTDPPNRPATTQRCRNDNIAMRRHCHLLLAKSSIEDAGWGIFTKHALKKGDFVHEYVGEMISQEEAERRGRIYDKVNRSYLFNLCSDQVIDASRKGNKSRFANHSTKPNCFTRILSVNGDNRIGLFASEDIEPQSELFFNYHYDATMDNHLIVKAGFTVDWQKNSKMANKVSKKKHSSQA